MGAAVTSPQDSVFGLPLLSVSQVNDRVRRQLEDTFPTVAVTGEIGTLTTPRSGHIYFTLRDDKALLSGAIWRGVASKLPFKPAEGMRVIVVGRLTLYPQRGQYQIIASQLMPAGAGALQQALEALKRKLAAEGLFDEALKKPLPRVPFTLGVITSSTGAAVHDIIRTALSRFPRLTIRLFPVTVQGENAAAEIAEALALANTPDACDVILVGRGGGSLEDLWAFNQEEVVRAVAASMLPVISCVGHETDTTLTDLAADLRASTPTRAAELAVPVLGDLTGALEQLIRDSSAWIKQKLQAGESQLALLGGRPGLTSPDRWLQMYAQQVDELQANLNQQVNRQGEQAWHRLSLAASRLDNLSPMKILNRGYGVVQDRNDMVVRSVRSVAEQDKLTILLNDGRLSVKVKAIQDKNQKP